jgi:hypothetical protein
MLKKQYQNNLHVTTIVCTHESVKLELRVRSYEVLNLGRELFVIIKG